MPRVTIRPALGGTVPLFQALSRFFDRKSRFLPQSNRTDLTKFTGFSNFCLTKLGHRDTGLDLIVEGKVRPLKHIEKEG